MKRLAAVFACAVAVLLGTASCGKKQQVAEPRADPKLEQIVKGKYLAAVGDCYACHTVRGGEDFAGGLEMHTPFGVLYTPNISPSKEFGIGSWTADDFWRALHEGKGKEGQFLYPAFPYNNYTRVTREDSDAMYAYLMSVKPAEVKSRPHEMAFPFNQRELLIGWRTLYFTAGVFQENPQKSKEWNRGAYLVEGLGHCNACHATRSALGGVSDDDYSGGLIPLQNWYAPSLTSSREAGLGEWEIKDIVEILRNGISKRGAVLGPMAEVVRHSLQETSLGDLQAMAVYLQDQAEKAPSASLLAHERPAAQTAEQMRIGEKVYKEHCEICHMADGSGAPPRTYPPLAGNRTVTLMNPINSIRVVLNGGFPPVTEANQRPFGMPPFYPILSDEEIAAVVTYIRQSWGNSAAPTWAIEVAKARGVPAD